MNPQPPLPVEPGTPPDRYHLLGEQSEDQGRRVFKTGLIGLGLLAGYLGLKANVDSQVHLFLGLSILFLALLPFLLWLRSGGSRFPVIETMLALGANAYAIPLLNGHEQLARYPVETVTRAGIAVVLFQLAAFGTYLAAGGRPGRGPFWTEPVVTPRFERSIAYGMILSALYQLVVRFTEIIPYEYESILRAVFFGVGVLSAFVTARRWGRSELSRGHQTVFIVALLVQVVVICTSLLLISAVTLIGIALLGYLSGGRRVPWAAMVVVFFAIAVLHNGKVSMREKYWEEGQAQPSLSEIPAFYSEWLAYGLSTPFFGDERSAGARLLERSSLLHILCLVVQYTPDRQPHLGGETYGYVLPQLVPRLLWPEKPRSHIATYRLSIYYGLQDEDATEATTIAFGLLAEAYANFGLWGGVGLGICFGFIFKRLQLLSSQSPQFSLAGIFMILLTAWSLSSELTLAAWVSSLFQATVVALAVPFAMRKLTGG
jgi:hypothetical protein